MKLPSESLTPSAVTAVTGTPVRISTCSSSNALVTASEMRSGSAGRMRGAASMSENLDVLLGIDLVEAEGDDAARRLVQLRGKLRPSRAGADDGDVQLPWADRLGLRIGAHAGVDQAAVEALGLLGRVER